MTILIVIIVLFLVLGKKTPVASPPMVAQSITGMSMPSEVETLPNPWMAGQKGFGGPVSLPTVAGTGVFGNGGNIPLTTTPGKDFSGATQTIPDVLVSDRGGSYSFSPGTPDSVKLSVLGSNGDTYQGRP